MRVVPVRGPESHRGDLRARQSAFPLCIAGEVLQITESTDEKLSGIPSGRIGRKPRSTSSCANVRNGWKADISLTAPTLH
jgi:hypothetical protein